MPVYRKVRDQIKDAVDSLYKDRIAKEKNDMIK